MAEINILDSSIFNRIAAGEVVDCPASVVKELIENSIDAGAKSITVEILSGGIDLIRVSDDGKGLSPEDMPLAFLPHATSKIKTIDDLNNIGTLGFRGEALPSIASVARVSMLSRTSNGEMGYQTEYEDGKLISRGEAGAPIGTTVTVSELFKNIPARRKFLKKPSSEAAAVTNLLQKIILSNPSLNIKYINDDNVVFHSSNDGVEFAIYTVYGEMLENLDYINSNMPDITLSGYISKPSYSKHNKNFQTLIVNGRIVENDEVSYWIYLCYQDYLMKRQYPAYVLYLTLPLDMVDVNVHPNKLDIKFADANRVKSVITGAIKKSINKEMLFPKDVHATALNSLDEVAGTVFETPRVTSEILFNSTDDSESGTKTASFKDKVYKMNFSGAAVREQNSRPGNDFLNLKNLHDVSDKLQAKASQGEILSGFSETQTIAGKLFNTYLIVQKGNSAYLIDQHAAHEKIIFDNLMKNIDENNIATQDLLIPYVFYVNNKEREDIEGTLDELNSLGFSISEFGENSFSISGIPVVCSNISLKNFVSLLVDAVDTKKIARSGFLRDAIAQSACRAAVKGSDDLGINEIESLLVEMENSGAALFCPHGRPTVVKLTRTEIEKWFKRIV